MLFPKKCFSRRLRPVRFVSSKIDTCFWKVILLLFSVIVILQCMTPPKFLKTKVRQLFLPMKSFTNCQTFRLELSALEDDLFRLKCADDKSFRTPDIDHVISHSAHVMRSVCAKNKSKDKTAKKSSHKIVDRQNCESLPQYPLITIVPYYERVDHLKIFLENFRLLMSRDEKLYLVICTITGDVKTVNETLTKILSPAQVSRVFIVQDSVSSPSRGRLRNLGAKHATSLFGNGAHLLFTDVDIMISRKFISRCRILSHQKDSVYFPVVWSEKKPYETTKNRTYNLTTQREFANFIRSTNGYWRDKGYGMVCTSGENFLKYGIFPEFDTWGLEDKYLFYQMADADLRVHRFNDTGLIHKWHPKDCSANKAAAGWLDRIFERPTLCEKIKEKNDS